MQELPASILFTDSKNKAMTPKTNREKAAYIMAEPEFNMKHYAKQIQFILRIALYTEVELSPAAWTELDEVYNHVNVLGEGDECPKKGPEDQELEQADKLDTPRFEYLATHYGKIPLVYEAKREQSLNTLKSYIREHFTANTEPQTNDSLSECGECGKTVPAGQLSVNKMCPECVRDWIK